MYRFSNKLLTETAQSTQTVTTNLLFKFSFCNFFNRRVTARERSCPLDFQTKVEGPKL